MYAAHNEFPQPRDENAKLWRYMDFTKLVSMLESQSLFLARADRLGDSFEGSYPLPTFNSRLPPPDDVPADEREAYVLGVHHRAVANRQQPKFMAVSCWHMNQYESAAMWRLYLKSDEGLAIQTRYATLREAVTDETISFMGVVRYIDYEKQWFQEGNVLTAFMHKRRSFEHEREVRIIVPKWPADWSQQTIDQGINLRVDLNRRDNLCDAKRATLADRVSDGDHQEIRLQLQSSSVAP
jgi:hypothetical protein